MEGFIQTLAFHGIPLGSTSIAAFISSCQQAVLAIGWFGDGTGTTAYHTFVLEKVTSGCHVVTEEVVKGAGAVEFRRKDPQAMHRGHELWLASLRRVSEK